MTTIRPPKKSESIEVRLSHAAKLAFIERCRKDRQTASDAIRRFIEDHVEQRPAVSKRPRRYWRAIAAVSAGAALGVGVAGPTLAHATQPDKASFDRLDGNQDGILTYREYSAR